MSLQPAPPTSDCRLFLENMRVLWQHDPRLAVTLDDLDDAELPTPEPARRGGLTVARRTPDGRLIYMHSRFDPREEARKWAAHVLEEDRFCYIIQGFALGYHVKELFEQLTGDIIVVVLEPDLHMLRRALDTVDLTAEFAGGRLVVITEPRKDAVHQRLGRYGTHMMMGTKIAAHAPSTQVARETLQELARLCLAFIDYAKTGMVTLVTNAQTTCRNIADNLATYLATPPINELKSRFNGYPAVIVSAGPSLRRNIRQLIPVQDRVVIIATQTTFKPLRSCGIVPSFVCSLDYHQLSRQYYEGVEDFSGTHLVAEPKAHHSVIDAFGGPVSLLANEFARTCLGTAHGARDGLRPGASVAHLAFYLAEYMGCDPIILIGQDLALTDHVYYMPGTAIHETWEPELNRFLTLEMKEWERIMRSKPILRTVAGRHGETLYTEELMYNYLEQFEKDFAATHARVINATEGGAHLRGCREMTLKEALASSCEGPLKPELLAYRRRTPWFDVTSLELGRVELQQRIGEMEAIRELCDQTIALLEDLKSLIDRPEQFNRAIKDVDAMRLRITRYERAYTMITAGAQLAEFRRFSADQKLKASGVVGVERARRQLDRDVQFVRHLRADTDRMIDIIQNACRRLEDESRARTHSPTEG